MKETREQKAARLEAERTAADQARKLADWKSDYRILAGTLITENGHELFTMKKERHEDEVFVYCVSKLWRALADFEYSTRDEQGSLQRLAEEAKREQGRELGYLCDVNSIVSYANHVKEARDKRRACLETIQDMQRVLGVFAEAVADEGTRRQAAYLRSHRVEKGEEGTGTWDVIESDSGMVALTTYSEYEAWEWMMAQATEAGKSEPVGA